LIKTTFLKEKSNTTLYKSYKTAKELFFIKDSINRLFNELDLRYKRVDKVEVYHLIDSLSSKKESNWI